MHRTQDTENTCSIHVSKISDERRWRKQFGNAKDAKQLEQHKCIIYVIRRGGPLMSLKTFYRSATNVIVRFMGRRDDLG